MLLTSSTEKKALLEKFTKKSCYTNPLQVGNLFDSHWNKSNAPPLRISLLKYYIQCGWLSDEKSTLTENCDGTHTMDHTMKTCDLNKRTECKKDTISYSNRLVKLLMLGSAARGDIKGMCFLVTHNICSLTLNADTSNNIDEFEDFNDETDDLVTVAGAAGQLEAVRWLIEEQKIRWDPAKVYREAAENLRTNVMMYVDNTYYSKSYVSNGDSSLGKESWTNSVSPYGEGMPW